MRWRYLKLDLPYLLGELAIVVVGVIIALAANGAYEDWKERRVEANYLQRIGAELESGAVQLGRRESRNSQSRAAGLMLIRLLEPSSPDEADVVENFLFAATTGGTAADSSHDTTFRELVSTGNLNIISDPDLRVEITEYYRQLDNFITIESERSDELLVLFTSLTGGIPEQFSRNVRDLQREFSDGDKDRIVTELLGDRDHYLRSLRNQTSIQGLMAYNLEALIASNRVLLARISSEF